MTLLTTPHIELLMITVDLNNIDELLQRFFDGATTCAEEKALQEYFTSGEQLPDRYKPYREMFGWYASGMDESRLPRPAAVQVVTEQSGISASSADREVPSHRWNKRMLVRWVSVAAAIVLAVGFGWNRLTQNIAQPEQPSIYAGSYIVRDGKKITGEEEIRNDVQATLIEGMCLDNEIDMRMAALDKERKNKL